MNQFKEITAAQFDKNPFMIGKEWMAVTAEQDGKVNAMTASWGGLGFMWQKNVAFIVLRPQRYTKELIDRSGTFSLNYLAESYRQTLGYLGKVSGRDEDKIAKSELTVLHSGSVPYFEEANTVLLCKSLFVQNFEETSFLNSNMPKEFYPDKDFHHLYIAEVERILVKE